MSYPDSFELVNVVETTIEYKKLDGNRSDHPSSLWIFDHGINESQPLTRNHDQNTYKPPKKEYNSHK